jgi:hypothetical protein
MLVYLVGSQSSFGESAVILMAASVSDTYFGCFDCLIPRGTASASSCGKVHADSLITAAPALSNTAAPLFIQTPSQDFRYEWNQTTWPCTPQTLSSA